MFLIIITAIGGQFILHVLDINVNINESVREDPSSLTNETTIDISRYSNVQSLQNAINNATIRFGEDRGTLNVIGSFSHSENVSIDLHLTNYVNVVWHAQLIGNTGFEPTEQSERGRGRGAALGAHSARGDIAVLRIAGPLEGEFTLMPDGLIQQNGFGTALTIDNNSIVNINGGTVRASSDNSTLSPAVDWPATGEYVTSIALLQRSGTLNINSGIIQATGYSAVALYNSGERGISQINMYGGEISATNNDSVAISYANSNITIIGGKIYSSSQTLHSRTKDGKVIVDNNRTQLISSGNIANMGISFSQESENSAVLVITDEAIPYTPGTANALLSFPQNPGHIATWLRDDTNFTGIHWIRGGNEDFISIESLSIPKVIITSPPAASINVSHDNLAQDVSVVAEVRQNNVTLDVSPSYTWQLYSDTDGWTDLEGSNFAVPASLAGGNQNFRVLASANRAVCDFSEVSVSAQATGTPPADVPVAATTEAAIRIISQPTAPPPQQAGSISGYLTVDAIIEGSDVVPRFQWQQQVGPGTWTNVSDATYARFEIPTDLEAGEHNFRVRISALDVSTVSSNPVLVIIE